MKYILTSTLFFLLPLGWEAKSESIDSVSFSIERSSENIIEIRGRWAPTEGIDKIYPFIPSKNSARIKCDFKSMYCKEARASIITPDEFPNLTTQRLFPQRTDYKIIEVTEEAIRAEHIARAAILTLTLNSMKSELCLNYKQRIKDKDGTIPEPQNWCLK